jgi:hypothetical protein
MAKYKFAEVFVNRQQDPILGHRAGKYRRITDSPLIFSNPSNIVVMLAKLFDQKSRDIFVRQ